MSAFDLVVSRFPGAKKTGPFKAKAKCTVHEDRSASVAITERDDGVVMLHCFAGCGAAEILDAAGLTFFDLYPPKPANGHYSKPVRRPWSAHDVLTGLALEVLIAYQFAKLMVNGDPLTDTDRERLLQCASRLQNGLGLING